jgi:hypothetical protein
MDSRQDMKCRAKRHPQDRTPQPQSSGAVKTGIARQSSLPRFSTRGEQDHELRAGSPYASDRAPPNSLANACPLGLADYAAAAALRRLDIRLAHQDGIAYSYSFLTCSRTSSADRLSESITTASGAGRSGERSRVESIRSRSRTPARMSSTCASVPRASISL